MLSKVFAENKGVVNCIAVRSKWFDKRNKNFEDHELEKVKTEIKKAAYSSFDNYNFWNELRISKDEFLALKGLSSNKDIILQKAYKGNLFVLVNKSDYTKRKKDLLPDVSKFK